MITTTCPDECPELTNTDLATLNTDYSVASTTITFSGTTTTTPVTITMTDDTVEEQREYFCLSVADSNLRGSQWYTRIIIPWNDRKLSLKGTTCEENDSGNRNDPYDWVFARLGQYCPLARFWIAIHCSVNVAPKFCPWVIWSRTITQFGQSKGSS